MPNKKFKKAKQEAKSSPKNDKTMYAFLATILSIVGFVIAIILKRDDKYVMYYAKQSLVIFIVGAVGGAIGKLLSFIPIMSGIINFGIFLVVFIAWLLSWIYALSGEEKPVPIIYDLSKNFNF